MYKSIINTEIKRWHTTGGNELKQSTRKLAMH